MVNANARSDKGEAAFEALIVRAERGRLDFDGLRELARLYRVKTAQLSEQRTRTYDQEVIRYLNGLCLRAYVHLAPPVPRTPRRGGFWLAELPAALGRTLRLQLLAAGLLALGALLGARLVLEDPSNLGATVPGQMYSGAALRQLYESEAARGQFLRRHDTAPSINTIFAGSLFAHNTRVGLLSLAAGILAALPSVVLLLYNGLTLGGFAAIFMRGATSVPFLLWLVPHAIPELLAIVLCSAAGLGLGRAVVAPGRSGRALALRQAAADALQLLAASVVLFVTAAFIESFVRESLLSSLTRGLVAGSACAALLGYVALVRWYARRSAPVNVSFLLEPRDLTSSRPHGSPGSDPAAAP
jgi:uncharacterized membrane protein SpoIIM required for sporulation